LSNRLFPLFLKLEGRQCLVVGAGSVGLEKIESLLRCGAAIRVVAPEATTAVEQLHAQGKVEWRSRTFQPEDVQGCELVIAATSDREVNQAVFAEASRNAIFCNTVDDPPLCDFYFGSVVQRGDLQIAISTAGESPALAQRLRREIDAQLPSDVGPWLAQLGELRREILGAMPPGDERKALLHELAYREVCDSPACPARAFAGSQVKHEVRQ
jgi:siroheme synthase-like protein